MNWTTIRLEMTGTEQIFRGLTLKCLLGLITRFLSVSLCEKGQKMQKDMSAKTDAMIEVCRRHVVSPDLHAILPEPYIPYIPDDWNGLLVLAESQNLASAGEYRERLEKASSEDRFVRLSRCKNGTGVGVQPWDDGHLKIAVKAALDVDPARTAVSNAVPWSQQKKARNEQNSLDGTH